MNGWARSGAPKGRSTKASSTPTGSTNEWPRQSRSRPNASTINLEKGINRLEEAIARCDTDDAYKSTLELYAVHIQTQRADISALRAELERAKLDAQKKEQAQSSIARGQLESLRAELDAREEECAAQRLRADELSAQVHSLEKILAQKQDVLNACCEQLAEERKWRKASLSCLRSELELAQETSGMATAATITRRKQAIADGNATNYDMSLTTENSEERPRSAPCQWGVEEEEGAVCSDGQNIKVESRCERVKVTTRRVK